MIDTTDTARVEIIRAVGLIREAGQVVEVRALGVTAQNFRRPHTESGYFDDPEKLADAVLGIEKAKGIYITANAVDSSLLARAANRIRPVDPGEPTTADHNITGRRWLLIDLDATRAAGISASDSEHEAAIELAFAIRAALAAEGWPEPIIGDSGNGAHLLYRIDLPADDGGRVERCLKALAARFNNDAAKVDLTTFNPARIWKLYGSIARKGDNTADRPHRMAKILEAPAAVRVVDGGLLEALAFEAPAVSPTKTPANGTYNGPQFDLDAWIQRHGLELDGPKPWQGGRKWIFRVCPWNSDHTDRSAFLIQQPKGEIGAGCHHQGCKGNDWRALRALFEPGRGDRYQNNTGDDPNALLSAAAEDEGFTPSSPTCTNGTPVAETSRQEDAPRPIAAGELIAAYPRLHEPIIDGLLRRQETCNIIAPPKAGKSWLAYGIGLSVVTEADWLGRFRCHGGRVLIVDNELHPATLAHRLPTVANAMQISRDAYAESIEILSLRGHLRDLDGIARILCKIEPRTFDVVILDALYRAVPGGTSENDNAAMARLFNTIDSITQHLECGWINIHHSTKGSQAEKSVTDVGAGAGSQARAADCHLVLRQHEDDGAVVLDAVVRSFPPPEPLGLRWNFPLWEADDCLDTTQLRGRLSKGEGRQLDRDKEGRDRLLGALVSGPKSVRQLRGVIGAGKERCNRLLDALESESAIDWKEGEINGGKGRIYSLKEPGL